MKKLWPYALILAVGTAVLLGYLLPGESGGALDDTYIHFQFARNLAGGHGFSFNPGQPMPGDTSPLWVLLLAGVYLITGEFVISATILAGIFLILSAAMVYRLGRVLQLGPLMAVSAALLTLLAGRYSWAAFSMETALFGFLSLAALLRQVNGRRLTAAGTAALAALARPEGYLLVALFLLDDLVDVRRTAEGLAIGWRSLRQTMGAGLLAALLVAPWIVFCLATIGRPFPTTFYAKAVLVRLPAAEYLGGAVGYWVQDQVILFVCLPLGIYLAFRRLPGLALPALWLLVLPLVNAVVAPNLWYYGRYIAPLVPLQILLGVVGMAWVGRHVRGLSLRCGRRDCSAILRHRGTRALVLVLVLGLSLADAIHWMKIYEWYQQDITRMHVTVGHWLRQNTPPDARIACMEVGGIGFYAQRELVDVLGLITPAALDRLLAAQAAAREDPLTGATDFNYQRNLFILDYLRDVRPDYFVGYPTYWPLLLQQPQFVEVFQTRVTTTRVCGDTRLGVYRLDWTRSGVRIDP
ncbi:MAG: hypothetical protein JXQ27_18890 [Acidobacteria bacterium]|nr:hypothetical protein [Acidobacteriota bacterium]